MAPTTHIGTILEREDLAAALQAAVLLDLHEGIDNHFSLVVDPGDRFLLNPFGTHWSEIGPDDLLLVSLEGDLLIGDPDRLDMKALQNHAAAHRAISNARCVLHSHASAFTAVASTVEGFQTRLTQASLGFHGRTVRVPYGGMALDRQEGGRLAAPITDDTRVVMLDNHGCVVVGRTVAEALSDLYFLDRACRVQVLAGRAGTLLPVDAATAERVLAQVDEGREHSAEGFFAALKRRLDREHPQWRQGEAALVPDGAVRG